MLRDPACDRMLRDPACDRMLRDPACDRMLRDLAEYSEILRDLQHVEQGG
jgi:hypothetical protein